eukprot:CAMPEP_0113505560 /NCGR_PEP_ID=MMETSP0014_2-20120614/35391_1 /TAXON_ID=2857 /ORGANISM="Nitzschia sp." /LENGTH=561 /DNA_ID=CAMNT_0000400899 /DNA_START=164 /DNA_END=1850 /DNA_ORIENTATION=- /assembly_acc=CAM_ASM_000159
MSSNNGRSTRRSRPDRYGVAPGDASGGVTRAGGGVDPDPVLPTPTGNVKAIAASLFRGVGNFSSSNNNNNTAAAGPGADDDGDNEGNEYEPLSPSRNPNAGRNDIFRDEPEHDDDDDDEEDPMVYEMTLQELLYSTSAFYAIVVPVTITMVLSALAVVYVNDEATLEYGAAAMNAAYATFDTTNASGIKSIALGLLNGLIMVAAIGAMTFGIVLLYKYRCMWCLIGYMMFASTSLLGFLGGNLWMTAINIYQLPVDWVSFVLFLWNFAAVGVFSIFYGKGVPKYFPQGYLICTSVILAWHLSYFDDVMAWTLLFMLAVYDLCAVLTPCGPLKFLVNAMSEDDAPEMPGLLYEAELPPEARRPGGGGAKNSNSDSNNTNTNDSASATPSQDPVSEQRSETEGPQLTLPLAVARVYNLPVVEIPAGSRSVMSGSGRRGSRQTNQPLLDDIVVPEDPSPKQLQADVIVNSLSMVDESKKSNGIDGPCTWNVTDMEVLSGFFGSTGKAESSLNPVIMKAKTTKEKATIPSGLDLATSFSTRFWLQKRQNTVSQHSWLVCWSFLQV